ncbi:MAG TPA: class I tRNA ligase family protein [Phycisphaerales bacterium]|nr:class I tRNA ligase family protein [Phycisphaerales bacterium]
MSSMSSKAPGTGGDSEFPFRYTAALASAIESAWQDRWDARGTFMTPNPGDAAFDSARPKKFVLDMFPYPSGVGLHVGHPLGYIATDIYARYLRMTGHNVLHTMGFDAFGLPAEQYAVQTGQHPRITTYNNIATMKAQLRRLGLGHDPKRGVSTTDPDFYRWTQWIFLQIYNSWYDPEAPGLEAPGVSAPGVDASRRPGVKGKARPISDLVKLFESGEKKTASGKAWSAMSAGERADEIDAHRLAFSAEVPVNWCPMLGTVLANEEVTADGRSERGNFPVYKRPLKQWIMRITAYAERLLRDLDGLDWPEPIKLMQRNWIGRSEGAFVDFRVEGSGEVLRVFTTRPDTLFGATYMVLSPEHPLVDSIAGSDWKVGGKSCPAAWRGTFAGAPAGGFATPRDAITAYRAYAQAKTDVQRTEAKEKTGVFIGATAVNPTNGESIPVFIADYVLTGYGTGAIMAVPAHDTRDFEFATELELPIRDVVYSRTFAAMKYFAEFAYSTGEVAPAWREDLADMLGIVTSDATASFVHALEMVEQRRHVPAGDVSARSRQRHESTMGEQRGSTRAIWLEAIDDLSVGNFQDLRHRFMGGQYHKSAGEPFTGPGIAVNSSGKNFSIDGLTTSEAKAATIRWLEASGNGRGAVTYKLRDWLFSRQRYWGEPFPIVYDKDGRAHGLPESMLPVLLPELENFQPESSDDPNAPPRPPLARARDWTKVTLDLGSGAQEFTRETNTMPNWAGSCWYYLRYLDPANDKAFIGPDVDRYWMGGDRSPPQFGGVDLYVGGVEHAVLHLLYARFWHKVLFDLGHLSTVEPFQKLFNQGYIQAAAFTDERGVYVEAAHVQEKDGVFTYDGRPVKREYGKMGKSLKNAVTPDDICAEYGCDTLRLYEMSMGPLEASKPWNTRDIVGSYRFLQRVWRNLIDEQTGMSRVVDAPADDATRRMLHKTLIGVRKDMESLGFNTAISKLIEFNNALASLPAVPMEVARAMILMLSPITPHIAEELYHRVVRKGQGEQRSILHEPMPVGDPAQAADDTIEMPVQVNGKLRSKLSLPAKMDPGSIEAAALSDEKVRESIGTLSVKKVIIIPGRMVNIVAG